MILQNITQWDIKDQNIETKMIYVFLSYAVFYRVKLTPNREVDFMDFFFIRGRKSPPAAIKNELLFCTVRGGIV